MRLRISITVGALLALLMTLPVAGASFTNPTSNDGNMFRTRQPIRTTTYELTSGVFTGTQYNLTLAQPLASDYFVILRGAFGANDDNTRRNPAQDYERIVADPFGHFNSGSTGASVLWLARGDASSSSWQEQVTAVESLDSQSTDGFTLRGVAEPVLNANATTGSTSTDSAWSSMGHVGLYGCMQGGGVSTTATSVADYVTAWGRLYPTGSNTVKVERLAGYNANHGILSGTATLSVYTVEWGSERTIQRVTVAGDHSGNGINHTTKYDTATITSVARANTFIIASDISNSNRLGEGWEGTVFTLSNGVNQNTNENRVAIGAERRANRKAEVYLHTHPRLATDYRFGVDGSIGRNDMAGTQPVDSALALGSYSGVASSGLPDSASRSSRTRLPVAAPSTPIALLGTAHR
ncbi:MAG: hypothetical protein ACNYZH_09745 [Acidimicrobiia bacterium]